MDHLDHDIVQDLLPLYHDNVCSEKSRAAVEEHLKACETCRAALADMDVPLPGAEKEAADDAAAVKKISGEWKKGKRRAFIIGIMIASVVCAAILVAAYRTRGFADCAYPLFAYNYGEDFTIEAGDSFSKTFNTRSLLHDDHDAFSVVIRGVSGAYQMVIASDGEVVYDSAEMTDDLSYQSPAEPGTEYTVTIYNLGETSFDGQLLISAYYWG